MKSKVYRKNGLSDTQRPGMTAFLSVAPDFVKKLKDRKVYTRYCINLFNYMSGSASYQEHIYETLKKGDYAQVIYRSFIFHRTPENRDFWLKIADGINS